MAYFSTSFSSRVMVPSSFTKQGIIERAALADLQVILQCPVAGKDIFKINLSARAGQLVEGVKGIGTEMASNYC